MNLAWREKKSWSGPEAALRYLHIFRLNVGIYETNRRREASMCLESESSSVKCEVSSLKCRVPSDGSDFTLRTSHLKLEAKMTPRGVTTNGRWTCETNPIQATAKRMASALYRRSYGAFCLEEAREERSQFPAGRLFQSRRELGSFCEIAALGLRGDGPAGAEGPKTP